MPEMSATARWFVGRTNGPLYRRFVRRWLLQSLKLPAGPAILEIGSGSGDLGLLVHELFRPSRLVETDHDPAQVTATRASFVRALGRVPPEVAVEQADALSLSYPDRSFDAAFAFLVLHHLGGHFGRKAHESFERGLSELDRLLKPGGQLVYLELVQLGTIRRFLQARGYVAVARHRTLGLLERAIWRKPG